MTRRANPKPRWRRYLGKDNVFVTERADDKARRETEHRENVKAQQAEGLESQAVRNRLTKRRTKTKKRPAGRIVNPNPRLARKTTTRDQRRAAIIEARKNGVRLTKTGRERQPARAVYRPEIDTGRAMVRNPNIVKSMRRRA
jgi:hypothetical protein